MLLHTVYKPGDYLECGFGPKYSKILILSEDIVIIKEGIGKGTVLTLQDWYIIIGENKSNIQNTTYFDSCKGCPFYKDDELNIESIEKNISEDIYTNKLKSCLRTSSSTSTTSNTLNKKLSFIYSPEIIEIRKINELKRTESLKKSKSIEIPKKKNIPWYYSFFICGLLD